MRYIPEELLHRILALPDDQPLQLIINTNGRGEWKTQVTLFAGSCEPAPTIDLIQWVTELTMSG